MMKFKLVAGGNKINIIEISVLKSQNLSISKSFYLCTNQVSILAMLINFNQYCKDSLHVVLCPPVNNYSIASVINL